MLERLVITLNDLAEKHGMSIDEIDNYITEHKKIEKELGIDLILYHKLEKLFFDDKLVIYTDEMTEEDDGLKIDEFSYGDKCLYYGYVRFDFKYYGKTWALTKEELEK